jgi:hypothetical protein
MRLNEEGVKAPVRARPAVPRGLEVRAFLAQAMEWIAEGKSRNWKYEKSGGDKNGQRGLG